MIYVRDIMTSDLVTLTPHDSLQTAREIMEDARIRHLLIVTLQGELVGMVSQRDLLSASVSKFADLPAKEQAAIEAAIPLQEVMATDVLTVPPDYPLADAANLLLAHKFGCLPVLERGKLRGIVTESDFVRLCLSMLTCDF